MRCAHDLWLLCCELIFETVDMKAGGVNISMAAFIVTITHAL